MVKTKSKKKEQTPQYSDNEEHSASGEDNVETTPKAVKPKLKKKQQTPLRSDNKDDEINEGANPGEIETLSDGELRVDAEGPNNDIINAMFKKIQTLTITCERQDAAVLRQAKMVTEAIKFTKEQVKDAPRDKQAKIIEWRNSLKSRQQAEIDAHKENIEMLKHFPSTHDRVFSHAKRISELRSDFTAWLDERHALSDEGDEFRNQNFPGTIKSRASGPKKRKRPEQDEDNEIDRED